MQYSWEFAKTITFNPREYGFEMNSFKLLLSIGKKVQQVLFFYIIEITFSPANMSWVWNIFTALEGSKYGIHKIVFIVVFYSSLY